MCGIAGTTVPDVARVSRMVEALRHRGPDGSNVVAHAGAALGCARLSIRGGARGDQPFAAGRGVLAFNGEIYNGGELVSDLARHGIAVDGSSDTEIVARMLEVYGARAVDRFNGMFALAWADESGILLARDPAGVKPLYYADDAFASEIAPLLEGRPRRVCEAALARWLAFHVAYGEETFFRGVRRVPPGGIVRLPGGEVVRRGGVRFSSPNPALTPERVRKVLGRAIADAAPEGRFGVALSGGVDSTLVAALAPGDRVAYHGRVAHEGCDESAYARATADALGIPLVEVPVTAEACWEALPRVVRALEEPVAGPGSLAQFLVARRAAEDVRVLLSGCAGDELFGGYARAAALVRDEPPPGLEHYRPLFDKARGLPPAERAYALLARTPLRRGFEPPREAFLEAFAEGGLDPLAAAARAEMAIILPGLLQVEDRVTMAHSIEGRVPLLDRRLLRVAARLAPEQRVDANGRAKALFRDAAAPHLPAAVRGRTDKMGFPLPLGDWLAGPWREPVAAILHDRRTIERGLVDPGLLTGHARYDRALYSAVLLELWHREFIDG